MIASPGNTNVDQHTIDKDKFDAYLKLANYYEGCYEERRQVEWKVSLGLWAVILTGIVSSSQLPRPPHFALWLIGVWLVYVIVWLIPILCKNMWDRELSHWYADAGAALIPAPWAYKNLEGVRGLLVGFSLSYNWIASVGIALLLHALSRRGHYWFRFEVVEQIVAETSGLQPLDDQVEDRFLYVSKAFNRFCAGLDRCII